MAWRLQRRLEKVAAGGVSGDTCTVQKGRTKSGRVSIRLSDAVCGMGPAANGGYSSAILVICLSSLASSRVANIMIITGILCLCASAGVTDSYLANDLHEQRCTRHDARMGETISLRFGPLVCDLQCTKGVTRRWREPWPPLTQRKNPVVATIKTIAKAITGVCCTACLTRDGMVCDSKAAEDQGKILATSLT
eukprot:SAG11_NODE_5362_length_1582_cov_1.622387_2_plen_193_part_00